MALPTRAHLTGNLKSKTSNLLISLFLFLLALLPRAYDLPRFVTADEAKWVYRSAQFLAALLRGDFPATSVNLTPAVTTTWLGSIGLAIYYQLYQATLNQPFLTWLNSLPEFRVQLDILVATRWPMVILTSLAVVGLYLITARLFYPSLAFLAAVFVALDPHLVALSRILGHDAPAAVFMSLSLLLLLVIKRSSEPGSQQSLHRSIAPSFWLTLSAVAAGLAFLSKAPTLFLIPFAGLVFFVSEFPFLQLSTLASFRRLLVSLFLWIAVAYLTFVIVWPAAWVDPLGRPAAVFQNAFISATDQEEASEEGFWRVPDLGPFYYLVNGGFKLSPLVLVGTGLAIFFAMNKRISKEAKHDQPSPHAPHASRITVSPCHRVTPAPLLWLLAFALLFTLFMTLSDKRSPRYILPIFPVLGIIAAYGWLKLMQVAGNVFNVQRLRFNIQPLFVALVTLAACITLIPYAPYYFTYYNPLLGGPYIAASLVKIGWGEGLDQVGRFLQREGDLRATKVGTAYASTVAPFFEGNLSSVTSQNLDYVVLYLKQVQSGEPSAEFVSYFEWLDPIFSVNLNGIHYADVYPGPALQVINLQSPREASNLYPLAFRPLTVYGHIGETLKVDVVWWASDPLPGQPVSLTLSPATTAEPSNSSSSAEGTTILAQGVLTRMTGDLAVSRHQFSLPDTLAPGSYALLVEGQPLGEVELRNFKVPETLNPLQNLVFGQQIAVSAFAMTPDPDYIGLTLALQAQQTHLPDYTVFVQLLNAETNERAAGVDLPPRHGMWPTSRWVKGEVVTDEYLVAVPPDFKPGVYKVIVGLYQPETGQRLTLPDGQDHWTLPYSFIKD
ncbi:MAG: phospholipid carrier-dependent glycosyltransferase [Anaerolineae bacterium]